MRCDLATDELPGIRARVVADPPWYPEHTRVFLLAAARLTSPGATILLAQPAVATRPGVLPERASILAFAHDTGLETIAIIPGALAYIDGLITNGKFCCARRVRLSLTWWRRPLRLRGSALRRDVAPAGEPDDPDLDRVPPAQPAS